MIDLINSGLFGSNLIEIKSPKLIARYNNALKSMGLETTKLNNFSIDKIGWSPEISNEKNDIFYLTHSLANPMAIILTIEQKSAPIYFPYHSFDKYMMDDLFDKFSNQIMDITTQEAIWLDLDNGVSRYLVISDLLLIDSVELKMDTPGKIVEHSKIQKELSSEFLHSNTLWQNEEAREALVESAKKYGDLRFRQLSVSNMIYMDLKIYFTKALGGVFIFRSHSDVNNRNTVVICEDKDMIPDNSKSRDLKVYHSDDEKALEKLVKEEYLELNLDYYRNNIDFLKLKLDMILGGFICNKEENIDYFHLSPPKKKFYIEKYSDDLPDIYFELESFIKKISKGKNIKIDKLSDELYISLLMPNSNLPEKFSRVLHRLLSIYDESDPIRFYRFRKTTFYDTYKTYSSSKKLWVRQFIVENYLNDKINSERLVLDD